MRYFETTHLVTSEYLNHHGSLFAARGAAWFIEAGYIAAAGELNTTEGLVLRCINQIHYLNPSRIGDLITCRAQVVYAGTTSLTVAITARKMLTGETTITGFATFVSIDETTMQKKPHPVVLDEVDDPAELTLREQARALISR